MEHLDKKKYKYKRYGQYLYWLPRCIVMESGACIWVQNELYDFDRDEDVGTLLSLVYWYLAKMAAGLDDNAIAKISQIYAYHCENRKYWPIYKERNQKMNMRSLLYNYRWDYVDNFEYRPLQRDGHKMNPENAPNISCGSFLRQEM
jgi:hypothetical protein